MKDEKIFGLVPGSFFFLDIRALGFNF